MNGIKLQHLCKKNTSLSLLSFKYVSERTVKNALRNPTKLKNNNKGPVIIYVGGVGGKSWGGPGLFFFFEKRGGPKENFTMMGGGSLCVL